IRDVHRGNSPMTGHIARKVVQFFNERGSAKKEIEKLSRREKEVLDRLAQGIPYKEIADVLSVSIDTVRKHIKGIYGKLNVHSRGDAGAKYLTKYPSSWEGGTAQANLHPFIVEKYSAMGAGANLVVTLLAASHAFSARVATR